jgi:TatA/E family protein of Tat protein translocase
LLLILVAALVVVGPRKLPELGRSLGRSINEFKRASADFQRTWEYASDAERAAGGNPAAAAALPGRDEPEESAGGADSAPVGAAVEAASATT